METELGEEYKKVQHTCKVCKKIFLHFKSYRRHVLRQHVPLKYIKCDQCPKIFYQQQTLRRHKDVEHSANFSRTKCHYCPATYKYREHLGLHMKKAHRNLKIGKSIGFIDFEDTLLLDRDLRHLVDIKRNKKIISVIEYGSLNTEVEVNEDDLENLRDSLKKVFNDLIARSKAQNALLNDEFETKLIENDETKFESDTDKATYACWLCHEELNSEAILYKHIDQEHSYDRVVNEEQYECELRKNNFDKKTAVMFECEQCNALLPNLNSLQRHILWEHEDNMTLHKCCKCGVIFIQLGDLEAHMNLEHVEFV